MPLKNFKELYNVDLKSYIKKKPTFKKNAQGKLEKTSEKFWLSYIEWATALFLLYEHGAETVTYLFGVNSDGYPAFYNNGKNPFVEVFLTIDGKEFKYQYPVIDGNRVAENPSQMVIHRAQQRALVKCIAVNTGLGLSLWQKEEGHFDDIETIEEKGGVSLPELLPNTPKWKEAVKALKNNYSLPQIMKKYYISDENQEKLINESL